MEWDKLSMADRARYIRAAVANGITNLSYIKDAYKSYAEGGYTGDENNPIILDEIVVTPQSSALAASRQATKPNTDFTHAQDMNWYQRYGATYIPKIPYGTKVLNPRTCINTVTGFYDPNNTVASNIEITDRPEEYGYKEIKQSEAVPGDIIMLTDKDNYPHHAVMFDSVSDKNGVTFDNFPIEVGDTLVNYSNGGISDNSYRLQQPLRKFLGPNSGGDFTGVHRYYRYTGKRKNKK